MEKTLTDKSSMRDLTTGPIAKKLYRFALPIIFTNLLQAIYNVADMVIVGRFLGSTGMAAVSVGGQVAMIVLVVIMAYSNAEAVVVGQMSGAGNKAGIAKAANSMLVFAIIVSLCLTAAVIAFSGPLLHGLNVEAKAFADTRNYLIVYMCGTIFVYIYNALYGLLRGIGESTAPMIFAIISTVVNLVLDVIFVGFTPMGTAGAALATVISQVLSVVMMIVFIKKKITVFQFSRKEFRIDRTCLGQLIKVGLPQMCQFVLTNISFTLIGALINSYGVASAAAAGAANKIYNFGILPGQAVMAAIITMTAQNLPGKNYKRIFRGVGAGMILTLIIGFALMAVCQFLPEQLLGMFTNEAEVIAIGIPFMRILVWAFIIENIMFCFFGLLTGAGYTHITMISAMSGAFIIRLAFSHVLTRFSPLEFNGIALAYVLAPCLSIAIAGLFTLSGRWKKPRVKTQ